MCLIRLKEMIMKLSEMETGRKGTIASVSGTDRFVSRVTAIGLTEGCRIEIVQNAKRRPLLVFERDSVVALDRTDCKNIEVDVLS